MLYLVTVLVSFVGAMLQGVTGFGASLTIMTLLPYFVDLPSAVALSGVIPMVQMAVLVWLYRRAINLHRVIIPAFFYLIGCWTHCCQFIYLLTFFSLIYIIVLIINNKMD